ncbi:hypothetical protein PT974_02578 [Cladobotryum mycophilum]|uniref:Uncharacterized protein n=1 Tax=Cladobotryum mycophilum TaxID=491253 RepID=A0ABR0SYK2_9HYPO
MEEENISQPGSPTPSGGPLQVASPDRVNRRESLFALRSQSRESTVHDKISQFNNLSVSMQSRQMERKTADAALKRAMLGREEAEAEMRRLKEEAKGLRKAIDEGKERERRVGERLETIMENYGRAKETHAHTQALWEKEIRRARKENFKAQSQIVKLQEELKSTRASIKTMEENLQREKERSHNREQEAFTARYQMVSLQEQLDQALEKIKLVEQERDAYKAAAKNEEIARIAAEGRIPLPKSDDPEDEFASPPKKKKRQSNIMRSRDARVSLTTMEIVSSAASELEIEQLAEQVQWERQRAERAQEMIEFMQAECLMHCCPCSKSKRRTSMLALQPTSRSSPDAAMHSHQEEKQEEEAEEPEAQREPAKPKKGPRLSTIFVPKEGIFRTVSEQEAIVLEAEQEAEIVSREPMDVEFNAGAPGYEAEVHLGRYARTPSVEPPTFALLAQERTSLLSLIDAPRGDAHTDALSVTYSIPTMPDNEPAEPKRGRYKMEEDHEYYRQPKKEHEPRPETSTSLYTVTTTTSVPVRESASSTSSFFSQKLRTPSSASNASFDLTDPAMTPSMTREQALAKIRERRGRARSAAAQTTTTTSDRKSKGTEKRDVSAPPRKAAKRPRRS